MAFTEPSHAYEMLWRFSANRQSAIGTPLVDRCDAADFCLHGEACDQLAGEQRRLDAHRAVAEATVAIAGRQRQIEPGGDDRQVRPIGIEDVLVRQRQVADAGGRRATGDVVRRKRHGQLHLTPGPDAPLHVGDRIRVWPAHIDPTVAYHEHMYVVTDARVVDVWGVDLRGW